MATQAGIIRIIGTIGDLSFYKSGDQYLAREKGGPSREQFKRSPAFAGSRKMSEEFGHISRSSSRSRQALITLTGMRDKSLYHRLFKLLRLVVAEDKTNLKGKRTVAQGLHTDEGRNLLHNFLTAHFGDRSHEAEVLLMALFIPSAAISSAEKTQPAAAPAPSAPLPQVKNLLTTPNHARRPRRKNRTGYVAAENKVPSECRDNGYDLNPSRKKRKPVPLRFKLI